MYHFLQFKPNKKEPWRLYDETQLGDLPQLPAFKTVLAVDHDPESFAEQGEDPLENVKYLGPMYFDFDGADLKQVLEDVRGVMDWLNRKLDIPEEFIHCWLSGKKGVHITVPAAVWGVKTPTKHLPLIYKEIAATQSAETLDRGVYSSGRGRMWRCECVKRPDTGTFKVGLTYSEMWKMDAEQYGNLVITPRPPMSTPSPAKALVFPKAESAFKAAKSIANKKIRAMKSATTIPAETLRKFDGIPGCVEKLITEGDCAESNWNQAAMQVASYVAARYSRDEAAEYEADIIEPFVKNVESSSRPTEKERRKHVQEQLNRAFSGRLKLSAGALIATIGHQCGHCPICRGDIASGEAATNEDDEQFEPNYRIKATERGYFQVNENGQRQLTSFTFDPHTYICERCPETGRITQSGMIGTVLLDGFDAHYDVEIPEEAWHARRNLLDALKGCRGAAVFMTDADAGFLYLTILAFARKKEMKEIIRTDKCGVMFHKNRKGVLEPHYVESEGAYARHEVVSLFKYSGDASQSPQLLNESNPLEGDDELEAVITHLTRVNEPHWVAMMLGWTVAAHFKEHLHHLHNQFPLLNISGGQSAGKSSTAVLMCCLGGIDYSVAEFMNVEVGTFYPLSQFVCSSTTVPRLVEEVNPTIMAANHANKVLGLFKAAWNRAPLPKGYISKSDGLGISKKRITAPIIYTSEQTSVVPSLRNRSVEVRLTPRALKNREYKENFKAAFKGRHHLFRMARALVSKSLSTSPAEVSRHFDAMEAHVPERIGERPCYSFQCVLFGLKMLIDTMDAYGVGGTESVEALATSLKAYLSSNSKEMEREKKKSEVDKVLDMLSCMAEEPDDHATGLRPGNHYWRQGNQLYLVLSSCMPRYCRYDRSVTGGAAVIRDAQQMGILLEGEPYFDRKEAHPYREGVLVHVVDMARLVEEKAVHLTGFQDGTEPTET